MSVPDLSIIIPTYNRLSLLKEALASFVGLLDCSYEAVIVDDGSTDGTAEYLRTLGEPFRTLFQDIVLALGSHRLSTDARSVPTSLSRRVA